MAPERNGFYEDPSIYDILHTPGTAAEVDVLESLLARHHPAAGRDALWLEPACGSGRFLRAAAGRGHRVCGFDRSPAMVRYARNGLAGAGRVFVATMQRFAHRLEPASVHLAFNTINTIRHLPADADYHAHLEQMARVLAPGGLYVVGISLSAYDREAVTEDVWEGRRGRCRVQQVVQYLPPDRTERVEEILTHLTIERPSGTEHRDHHYGLRSFNRKQWRKLLRSSPLAVVETCSDRGQAMQDHDGNYFLYVLRRR